MTTQITSHKVFIASPGGLADERSEFQKTLQKHNEADAFSRKCMFTPVCWELTLGGVGRPQEKVNDELRQCDYFVLILWDRWGSPTGSNEKHTSGTGEEYDVALSCLCNEKYPMRELIVFFKTVDERQLSDPGPQLQQVLKFKTELEESKAAYYETFDTSESFGEKLRRYLSKWTRHYESTVPTSDNGKRHNSIRLNKNNEKIDLSSDDPKEMLFTKSIENIYKVGNLTEAEQKLVSDVVAKRTVNALYSYGLFLQKAERFSDSERIFSEMSKLASLEDKYDWAGTAEARLGAVYRFQGKVRQSREALERAIELKTLANDIKGAMSAYIWLGDLEMQYRHNEKALLAYEPALALSHKFPNAKLTADIQLKCAKCLVNLGRVEDGVAAGALARQAYIKINDKIGVKAIKDWKKSKKLN